MTDQNNSTNDVDDIDVTDGFEKPITNGLDAAQISLFDIPLEAASNAANVAIRIGTLVQDLAQQYSQTRPWLLLESGAAYSSSAMPQKRNPGLVNNCRTESSSVIGEAQAEFFRAHNLQSGMIDPKNQTLNSALALHAVKVLTMFNRVLKALVINKDRALEELNSDWTASQEVADRLMKEYGVPFRIGHHAASHIVSYARANNILPLDFPYAKMQEIYKEVIEKEFPEGDPKFPMSEEEFREALNPVSIVHNRKTLGGPQPAELERMLKEQTAENHLNEQWVADKKAFIQSSLDKLNKEFETLGE